MSEQHLADRALARVVELEEHRAAMLDEATKYAEELVTLRAAVERLEGQLPDGMKHCTIVYKACGRGHGWLTATNWVQHGCPTCERDKL